MRHLRIPILPLSVVLLLIALLPAIAISQSGRGRPRVPTRDPVGPPPPPAKIPEATAVVKQEQAGNTSRFVLRNGITVLISEQHATPLAASMAYFKVGAVDEPEGSNGISRLVKHFVSRQKSNGPADRSLLDLRAMGVSFGARVSFDSSSFYLVAPSQKVLAALAIQAAMLQNPSFTANELRQAIPFVVATEKLGVDDPIADRYLLGADAANDRDYPSAYALARLRALAFAQHRLGQTALLTEESLRSLPPEQLADFYKTYYKPDKLVIAVVGDVTTFNTLVEIQRLYGAFGQPSQTDRLPATGQQTQVKGAGSRASTQKPGQVGPGDLEPALPTRPAAEPEQASLRYGSDRGDISQSIVSAGFHIPGLNSSDWPAIEVLSALLGQGRASRLYRPLLDGQDSFNKVKTDYLALSDIGLLAVQIRLIPDSQSGVSIDKAESILFREIDRLRRETPSEGEMARARTWLEKRFIDRNENYLSSAWVLASAEALNRGFRSLNGYRNRIREVKSEDVQRVAARYLTLGNATIHEYEPFSAQPRTFDAAGYAATVTAWAPGFALPVEAKDVIAGDGGVSIGVLPQGPERSDEAQAGFESIQPVSVKDFSTYNGPRAFVREDHSQPKVTIAILFQGGRIAEDQNNTGLTELMLRSMLYGSARRTAVQVAHELEQLGADAEIVAEPEFFGLAVSVISRNAERAIKVIRDLIEEPAFLEEDIKRARTIQAGIARSTLDSSLARSRHLLFEALFPDHSYSLPPHGRIDALSKISADQLRDWHLRTVKRQLPLAVIVGDTDGSALVSGQVAEGFKRRELDRALPVKVPPQTKPAEKGEQRRVQHTAISAGVIGPKRGAADLDALEFIETAMNGNGGRLQTGSGDTQPLAYSAKLDYEALFLAGAIYVQVLTAPENEQRARAGLLSEFERLGRVGLSAEEIASNRALAAGSKLFDLQSQMVRILEYSRQILYLRPASDVDTADERLSKISAEDIRRVMLSLFKPASVWFGVLRGSQSPVIQTTPKQD